MTEQSLPHIEANLTINIEEVDDNETQCEHQLKNRYQYVKNDEIITHYKKSSNSNDDPSSEEGMIKEVGQSLRNGNPYKIPTPSPNFDYSYSTTSMEYYEPPFEDHLSNHTHSDDIPSNLSTELNTNSEHESVKIANKCSFCEVIKLFIISYIIFTFYIVSGKLYEVPMPFIRLQSKQIQYKSYLLYKYILIIF